MSAHRIMVTTKGETGYLVTSVDMDTYKIRAAVTLEPEQADTFEERERAERFARKMSRRFDAVEVVTA